MAAPARPMAYDDLARLSDPELVALARQRIGDDEAGCETAKRCVALVFERHRGLVRGICAGKAPAGVVDDLESSVYVRFVRAAYLQTEVMVNPAGLLVKMTFNVVASHFAKAKDDPVPFDQVPDVAFTDDGYDEPAVTEAVEGLLSILTPRQREVVWRKVMEGEPSADIAARLDTTPGNVDVIFFRAMRKLREAHER